MYATLVFDMDGDMKNLYSLAFLFIENINADSINWTLDDVRNEVRGLNAEGDVGIDSNGRRTIDEGVRRRLPEEDPYPTRGRAGSMMYLGALMGARVIEMMRSAVLPESTMNLLQTEYGNYDAVNEILNTDSAQDALGRDAMILRKYCWPAARRRMLRTETAEPLLYMPRWMITLLLSIYCFNMGLIQTLSAAAGKFYSLPLFISLISNDSNQIVFFEKFTHFV